MFVRFYQEKPAFPVCDDVFPVMSERGDGEAVRVSGQKRHKLPDPGAAAPRPGRLLPASERKTLLQLKSHGVVDYRSGV